MDKTGQQRVSHLFLVRVWLDEIDEVPGWHGKVQHLITGRSGGFDSPASMLQLLATMLPVAVRAQSIDHADDGVSGPGVVDLHTPAVQDSRDDSQA